MKKVWLLLCALATLNVYAQDPHCDNNPARAWWDTESYRIDLQVDTATGYLRGQVRIAARVVGTPIDSLQIDLMEPMNIKEVSRVKNGEKYFCGTAKNGPAYYIHDDFAKLSPGSTFDFTIAFEGRPQIAANAPWDGGLVLSRDHNGKRWIGLACQGQGASVWLPCKDYQGDEPGVVDLFLEVPHGVSAIANGQRIGRVTEQESSSLWNWRVVNPINLYDISFYIGDYVHWADTLAGAKGTLPLDFYVLRSNLAKAKAQFKVVKPMLQCFEEKLGPYPFYEDGYKLVEAPYLGMEHQSAIAYGNKYKMGYLGRDRSRTKVGLDFDYIIIHESGHEWFGNNITTLDKADTWVHEGFTTYTETIFEECLKGKTRAFTYQKGKKHIVRNDRPVQGAFHICDEGSGDHYEKGAFLVHMIRMIMQDDAKFFAMLREMNARFYHKIVNGKDIEAFMSEYSGKDLSRIFDQYLRESGLPRLEIKRSGKKLAYRWTDCVAGFDMPVLINLNGKNTWIAPRDTWQELPVKAKKIKVDENFLVN